MNEISLPLESLLPPAAVEKAYRLIEAPDALWGALRLLSADEDAARLAKQAAERDFKDRATLMATTPNGRTLHEDLLNQAQVRLDRSVETLRRRSAATKEASEPYQAAAALRENLVEWLGQQRRARIHSGEKVLRERSIKPESSSDPTEALSKVRAMYEDFNAEEARIRNAPLPIEEVHDRITSSVDALAAKGAPEVDVRIRDGDPSKLAARVSIGLSSNSFRGDEKHLSGDGGAQFFTWLMRDEIVRRLIEVAGSENAPGAMSNNDRKKALAALDQKRLDTERREEAVILGAEARGIRLARRAKADPRAVLEVDVVER